MRGGIMARKRRSVSDFKILLLAIGVCFLFALVHKEYRIYKVNQEFERTQQRIELLKKEKEELDIECQKLGNLNYIEKLAREEAAT